MSDRARWITHNGKQIVYIDYTGLSSTNEGEFIKALDEAKEFILNAGKNLLVLVDVRDSYGNSSIVKRMKEDGETEKPFVAKEAVVGISGFKEMLLKGVKLFTKIDINPFKTLDEAKDWLAS